jgi:hypothetical protein
LKVSFLINSFPWEEWHVLINNFIFGEIVVIKINDNVGRYFQRKNNLRQSDPLSPMLFSIVADMVGIIIERAKVDDRIEGLVLIGLTVDCLSFNIKPMTQFFL